VFYWFLKWVALGPVLRLVFRPQISGAEHVPAVGPAILASNHLSYSDWLFMPLAIPRRVTFVAKAEYFNTPGLKGWFQKKFFSGSGQVPIDRSGASAAEGALSAAKRILAQGELFGIYPEGTRSHDGKLYRGKTGVARLAIEAGDPVKPWQSSTPTRPWGEAPSPSETKGSASGCTDTKGLLVAVGGGAAIVSRVPMAG
jgi:1-acyl-sn-glycerol-3-phosphate acyltransferase